MTIKQLIGLGPYELEKMSVEQLTEHCKPLMTYAVAPHVKQSGGIVDMDDGDDMPADYHDVPKAKRQKKKAKERWELEARELMKQYNITDIKLPNEIKL